MRGDRPVQGALLATSDRTLLKERLARRKAEAKVPGRDHRRLQANDRLVLADLLDRFNHVTGELYPAQGTIADEAGVSRRFVVGAPGRLKALGFFAWVRRTKTKEGAAGQAGPQLEQTSDAYHFDWRQVMSAETWRTFWSLVTIGMRGLQPTSPPPRQQLARPTLRWPPP